jgi:hypothetical protein
MPVRVNRRVGVIEGVIVLVVGVLVLTVVLGLSLIPRLSDGQKVLDSSRPVFQPSRLAGDAAGINLISKDVDTADPLITANSGAAAEVPKLVAFVSKQTGLSQAQVVAALAKNFPHTLALLQTLPLSSVTAELPGLEAFLEKALKVTPAQLTAALSTNFPAITQAISNLPTVTNGWEHIPGIDGMTRFNGTPVTSVPDLRTYFKDDLIPAAATNRDNFRSLDSKTTVNWIAPLLLIVSIIVILFGLLMILRSRRGVSTGEARAYGIVVAVVGVAIVALVLVINLTPRVSNGQKLLDNLKPAFAANRVKGDRTGVNMVSAIVATEDPIMNAKGGAAAEVPKLVAFVSKQTGLSQAQVVAALAKNFPHTLALLQAIPLSSVTAELPGLETFLEGALKVTPAQLGAALSTNFPAITQAISNLPAVTNGWDNIPGIGNATTHQGAPIRSVPDISNYFSKDVIPVLESQRQDYDKLTSTSKINFLGPLVLAVGIVVILYGLLMIWLAGGGPPKPRRREVPSAAPADGATGAPA